MKDPYFHTKDSGERFGPDDYSDQHARVFAARYDDGLGACKIATFQRLAGPLTNCRVLDLGCGEGSFSRVCHKAGAQVVAADFASAMVRATAERTGGTIPIVRASADAIPQRDASFDVVLALDVIEHLYQPEQALDEIHRVLRPGGALLLATDREGLALGDLPYRFRRVRSGLARHTPEAVRGTLNRLRKRRSATAATTTRGTANDPDRYHTPLCTHTHEFPLAELIALSRAHGFELSAVDTYPHRDGYGRWGNAVEWLARGPLRRYKWNYVMIRLRRVG